MDKRTRIGIVFGTGSNAAYVEQADRVKHWEGKGRCGAKQVCIDIEWGAFGDKGSLDFLRTKFDELVDQTSLLPRAYTYVLEPQSHFHLFFLSKSIHFRFEKYIGGKYLGELVRLILEDIYKLKLAFTNTSIKSFPKPWTFDTSNISIIEE